MSEYVAILAGGSGTRLWPLSRSHRPKQLLTLLGDRSLVQSTVDRVLPLVPPERVLIVTEASHADDLAAQLPELPPENILVEPARRGTAAAVGLAATVIAHRDADATMASLHSDAAVLNAAEFRRALTAAFQVARAGEWLVTLGIKPSSPHTGMGYIQVGTELGEFAGRTTHQAIRFVEKPDRETALRFIGEGYVWNPGMFIWRVEVILAKFARHLPEAYRALQEIAAALGGPHEREILEKAYPQIPLESIDRGIMERATGSIATIPSDFGWSDVGSWAEILAIATKDDDGNVARGDHLGVDTHRTLVFAEDRPVFTLGVEDLVIVSLSDAVLVCHRDRAEHVREIVERLQDDPARAGLL